MQEPSPIQIQDSVLIHTQWGATRFISFSGFKDNKEHFAILFGALESDIQVRIHSECITGDLFRSRHCDCGMQLEECLERFSKLGGLLIYLRQEGRGIGLFNKLKAYQLQQNGSDTFEANQLLGFHDDLRDFEIAAQMLKALDIRKIQLITNNPEKALALTQAGLTISKRIATGTYPDTYNKNYLLSKLQKKGHLLSPIILSDHTEQKEMLL